MEGRTEDGLGVGGRAAVGPKRDGGEDGAEAEGVAASRGARPCRGSRGSPRITGGSHLLRGRR